MSTSVNGVVASGLNLLNMSSVIIEPNGPIYNGPGASKPLSPFALRTLELPQREAVEKAKKYAMEQSIRAVLLRQTQSQQSLQMNNIKKSQTIGLLNRVYVGSIAYDVQEDSLRQSFQAFGSLKTVTMSWDPATQKHKGFAFLEFEYPEAAQLAIEQMNNASFGGRQLKVGRPSNLLNADTIIAELVAEHKLENRIYVAGVHPDLIADDVSMVFEAFGQIVFCRLQPDPTGKAQHQGFGYIEYQTSQSASDAVASMNQFSLGGQLLRVCKAISPPEGINSLPSTSLPPAAAVAAASATAKVLFMEAEQIFSGNGGAFDQQITPEQSLSADRLTSGSFPRGFNHENNSNFATTNSADHVASSGSHNNFDSMNSVHPSHNHLSRMENSTSGSTILILRNMVGPEDCDDQLEDEVASECSTHGAVQRVVIHQFLDHQSTGELKVNVFVVFDKPDAVHKAIEALDGRFFAGRQIVAQPYDTQAFMENELTL